MTLPAHALLVGRAIKAVSALLAIIGTVVDSPVSVDRAPEVIAVVFFCNSSCRTFFGCGFVAAILQASQRGFVGLRAVLPAGHGGLGIGSETEPTKNCR